MQHLMNLSAVLTAQTAVSQSTLESWESQQNYSELFEPRDDEAKHLVCEEAASKKWPSFNETERQRIADAAIQSFANFLSFMQDPLRSPDIAITMRAHQYTLAMESATDVGMVVAVSFESARIWATHDALAFMAIEDVYRREDAALEMASIQSKRYMQALRDVAPSVFEAITWTFQENERRMRAKEDRKEHELMLMTTGKQIQARHH
jgi:hypothetical protein